MRKALKLTTLCILLFTLFMGCKQENQKRVIKLAHGLDMSHPIHKALAFMAEKVAEKSGNTMEIKIYPSSQLGTERECVELLQIGSLGMTKVSSGTLENFAPSLKIFSLPFLFNNRQHSFDVFDGPIGTELLGESEKFWLKGLAFYDAGSRSFYTKERPIHTPDDLKGLKIRVMQNESAMKMVSALGGSPTPISWGELYTALQQGIVDGAENNPPSFHLSHHYEVCKYYIIDEHTTIPDVLVISTVVWNSLNDQQKQWVQEACAESVVFQRKEWKKAEAYAIEEVKKAGVEVIYPEKSLFQAKVKDLYEAYKEDPEVWSIIQKIKSAGNEKNN